MDGTFDLEVEEQLDGVKATVQKARLQYRGGLSSLPRLSAENYPHRNEERNQSGFGGPYLNGQIELQ